MANDREEREREEREASRPKIIDNRMLSAEERTGKGPIIIGAGNNPPAETPRLEIIGGRSGLGESALHEDAGQAVSAPIASGDAADATETVPTAGYDAEDALDNYSDEIPSLEEQFAALEAQFGRPLTDAERDQVRAMNESEEPMPTPAEVEAMRAEIEQEQFAALEAQFGRPLTDEEKTQVRAMMEKQQQSMQRLEVAPMLLQTVSEIPKYAAVHLGLVANPYTGIIARDDAEARLAIDAFGAMVDVLKTRLDPRTSGELQRVLTDLRANYTRITGISFAPPSSIIGPRIIR